MRLVGLVLLTAKGVALTLCAGVVVLGVANVVVLGSTRRQVRGNLATLPRLEAALVLGCAPTLLDGRPNFYFEARLDAAAQLFHSGCVQRLIVSGGPLRRGASDASECDAMLEGLVRRGVPREQIVVDRLGTRTWRSIVRLRDEFRLNELTIVSQAFHLPRAVYLARHIGIRAFGYAASSPPLASGNHLKVLLRETFSRARALVDVGRAAPQRR